MLPAGLVIGCVPRREDPRDALIAPHAASLAALPQGARVGTASLRRQAQIRRSRARSSHIAAFRGNVGRGSTRSGRGDVDATFLAAAGLQAPRPRDAASRAILAGTRCRRPSRRARIGVEIRADDARIPRSAGAAIDHHATALAVTAERAFLAKLDGSCRTPIAALAELAGGRLVLPRPDPDAGWPRAPRDRREGRPRGVAIG